MEEKTAEKVIYTSFYPPEKVNILSKFHHDLACNCWEILFLADILDKNVGDYTFMGIHLPKHKKSSHRPESLQADRLAFRQKRKSDKAESSMYLLLINLLISYFNQYNYRLIYMSENCELFLKYMWYLMFTFFFKPENQ